MGRRSHLLSYRFCKPPARDAAVELLVLDQTARRPHLSEGSDKFNIMLSLIADVWSASLPCDPTAKKGLPDHTGNFFGLGDV